MKDKKFLRIVKRAIKGDQKAFAEIIRLRGKNILYVATSLMRNRNDGEDVAQEAVLLLKRDIVKLKNPEAFDSWMYRLVYHASMNAKKKMIQTGSVVDIDDSPAFEVPEDREELLPEDFLHNEEKRKDLIEAIKGLPERYQMCVLMFYYQDMSYIEIADVLGISVQDVANTLSRARKKLRGILGAGDQPEASQSEHDVLDTVVVKHGISFAAFAAFALQVDANNSITPLVVKGFLGAALVPAVGVAAAGAATAATHGVFTGLFGKAIIGAACAVTALGAGSIATIETYSDIAPTPIEAKMPSENLESLPLVFEGEEFQEEFQKELDRAISNILQENESINLSVFGDSLEVLDDLDVSFKAISDSLEDEPISSDPIKVDNQEHEESDSEEIIASDEESSGEQQEADESRVVGEKTVEDEAVSEKDTDNDNETEATDEPQEGDPEIAENGNVESFDPELSETEVDPAQDVEEEAGNDVNPEADGEIAIEDNQTPLNGSTAGQLRWSYFFVICGLMTTAFYSSAIIIRRCKYIDQFDKEEIKSLW